MKALPPPEEASRSLPQRRAFVVQLTPDASRGHFAGCISHVVSARSARFASSEECFAFIERVLREQEGQEEASS